MSPLLDLSDADTAGFVAMPSGTYDATIYEAKMDEVKNADGTGVYPAGTPMIKVQFKIIEGGEEGEFYNRRAFTNFIIPPAKGVDKEKAAKTKGFLVRFLIALGYDEVEIAKPDFDLDLSDVAGRECRVALGQKPKWGGDEGEMENVVKGVKAAGSGVAAGGLL